MGVFKSFKDTPCLRLFRHDGSLTHGHRCVSTTSWSHSQFPVDRAKPCDCQGPGGLPAGDKSIQYDLPRLASYPGTTPPRRWDEENVYGSAGPTPENRPRAPASRWKDTLSGKNVVDQSGKNPETAPTWSMKKDPTRRVPWTPPESRCADCASKREGHNPVGRRERPSLCADRSG